MILLERKDPSTAFTVRGVTDWIGVDMASITDKSSPTPDNRCGTRAGYKAHQRRGEFTCQFCRNAMALLSSEQRSQNPEKKKAQDIKYSKEHREERSAYNRQFRLANLEKVKAGEAAYRKANVDKEKARHSKYYIEHPEIGKRQYAKWKARNSASKSEPTFSDKCGTHAGYSRHQKNNESPCVPCKKARSTYHRDLLSRNPDKVEKARKQSRDRYKAKSEEIKSYVKKYVARYPEKTKAWRRAFYLRNPEKALRDTHKRRAQKLKNDFSPYTTQQILDLYGSDCHVCKEPIDLSAPRSAGKGEGWQRGLQIDHVIPLSKGGSDTLENTRPAHGLCNLRKGGR